MDDSNRSFSQRFGYRVPDAEITVREEAPEAVRDGILMLGYGAGVGPDGMRELLCTVLLKRPDPNNWSSGNVEREVSGLIDNALWYKVYDFAERLYRKIGEPNYDGMAQQRFQEQLNQLFREQGVGWEMKEGILVARGSEAFAMATGHATEVMARSGAPTAANEIHEALRDISRRPKADITGAVQHAMAALECVARKVDGSNDTLGQIIKRLELPAPLDGALHKLWGFASEQGRHIQEGRDPAFEEAELVVTVASAVSVYLLRRRDKTSI
ncbi:MULTISPECIES: AbiJ-NTD4 domain-containing protein [unclassified Pannonibacter]|uniref:AbiJ-NTD4 domain-containing protein n=1 Tax=unclassified Pannonibacter TaxID=2627228 RepID=UPI001646D62F|nr:MULTISPECIES: hypothetical protein [unclassified Pannonibacter]